MTTSAGKRGFDRAARLIERVSEGDPAPALGELAAAEGLSAFHAQRSFSRYIGLSPKRFAAFASVCRAKGLLEASRSVLDVALELGLSGPARLHDRFVAVEAVTPGEFASGGEGVRIGWGMGETPFGDAVIGWTARGICRLDFHEPGEAEDVRLRRSWPRAELARDDGEAARWLARVFASAPDGDLRLLMRGSEFQIAVWRALLAIPEGQVATYQRIADAIGRPTASRAVAGAIGDNPIAVLIPCHRVIRSTGLLGGYRWGLERKMALLAGEIGRR
jgi:AraC family transcriptional regulator of adaptative response/methylated-DNA-[protein]-cysteine methyltransferase